MLGPCPVPYPLPACPAPLFTSPPWWLWESSIAAFGHFVFIILMIIWVLFFIFLHFFDIFFIAFYAKQSEGKEREREREREGNKKMKNFAAETSLRAQLPERGLPLCAEHLSRCLPQPLLLLVDVIKISFSGHRKCHTMAYRYTPHTHTHSHTNSLTAK